MIGKGENAGYHAFKKLLSQGRKSRDCVVKS